MRKPIKPCPFCGSFELLVERLTADEPVWCVACDNCDALGPPVGSPEQAVIDWEIRVPDIPRPQASTPPLITK